MATAVRDGLVGSNPFTIIGAGIASAPERPYLSPADLSLIVDAMPQRYRVPLLTMYGAHLRLGELIALQRGDFDAEAGTLRVERQAHDDGSVTQTKTGNARTVTLPPSVRALLAEYLADGQARGLEDAMFNDRRGALARHAMQQAWRKAANQVGLGQFHLHDVRHAGLTVAAQSGATTRELMHRAGHRTAAAAMTYQHVAEERNALLATQMDAALGTNWARGADQGPLVLASGG